MGKLDNTLIIYISGDNGSSAEGSPVGTPNEMSSSTESKCLSRSAALLRRLGFDKFTYPHMAVGWTWAMSTPYRWTKQMPSYFGGTRNGLVISWPGRIKGRRHSQPVPSRDRHRADSPRGDGDSCAATVDGIDQSRSRASAWSIPSMRRTKPHSTRKTQYFEMFGMRGIYHEGWMASTVPSANLGTAPHRPRGHRQRRQMGALRSRQGLDAEPTSAAENPDKLKELQDLFWVEAAKYQVLPLDASALTRFITPRPSIVAGRNEFTYTQADRRHSAGNRAERAQQDRSRFAPTSTCRRAAQRHARHARRPLWRLGILSARRQAGLHLQSPRSCAAANREAGCPVPGKHKVEFVFEYDGPGLARVEPAPSRSTVSRQWRAAQLPHTCPSRLEASETFDIGSDTGTGVNDADYQPPFKFDGKIEKLTINLEPSQGTEAKPR
jgi:hypothetical protein